MASPSTSGSYAYTQSAIKLIKGALRLLSVINEQEQPDSFQSENALDSLNAMVKGWQASGIHVWCEEECILFMQPGQTQYELASGSPDKACLFRDFTQTAMTATAAPGATSINVVGIRNLNVGDQIGIQLDAGTNFWTIINAPPSGGVVSLLNALPSQATSGALVFDYATPLMRPLRVPEGRRYLYSSRIETPLIPLARFDYDYLPNKYNTGTVTQFFYDPQTGEGAYAAPVGLMNVWPTPNNNTSGLRFVSQRPIQDFATLANIPDFPSEWLAALRWNLAVELAPEYDVPADRFDRIKAQADMWFGRASAWDREPEAILFGCASEPGYRS